MASRKAFALVELLVVVAVIAMLCIVAIPSFHEAQNRSNVSRAKADMRSLASALDAYATGNAGKYPNCSRFGISQKDPSQPADSLILELLTTPVAYISNVSFKAPFRPSSRYSSSSAVGMSSEVPTMVHSSDLMLTLNCYHYQSWNSFQRYTAPPDAFSDPSKDRRSLAWTLHSCGPAQAYYNVGGVIANDSSANLTYTIRLVYDPTNGTTSKGAIWRTGGNAPRIDFSYSAGEGLVQAIRMSN